MTKTGFAYRWARNIIGNVRNFTQSKTLKGLPKENVGFLLAIHQGSFTGSPLVYTLISSGCLILMLLSGVTMIPWVRSLTSNRPESTQPN